MIKHRSHGSDGERQEANGISPREDRQPRRHDVEIPAPDDDPGARQQFDGNRLLAVEKQYKAMSRSPCVTSF